MKALIRYQKEIRSLKNKIQKQNAQRIQQVMPPKVLLDQKIFFVNTVNQLQNK